MDFEERFFKINLYRDLVQLVLFLMLGMLVTRAHKVETTHWSLKKQILGYNWKTVPEVYWFFFSVLYYNH